MNLAFYYHIPAKIQGDEIKFPGFLGVFIDALAREVNLLVLLVHEANKIEEVHYDYSIASKNIKVINLGHKTPAWHRELFHGKILKSALKEAVNCDALIVRSPTPLAAYFHKSLKKTKLWFMIVGDYLAATDHYQTTTLRNRLIYYYLHWNDYFFQKRIQKTNILVNSPALYKKYEKKAKSIHLIKTTTLSEKDFFYREDTCHQRPIELLYTGQFSPAKGLFELVEATAILIKKEKLDMRLNLVGWEESKDKPVEKALLKDAEKLEITNRIFFHGKKKLGNELNTMYRMADIYLIPSHYEGFPRTIWEAMANSLPVIATKVGGIPEYIENERHALLIAPKKVDAIIEAIKRMVTESDLRRNLIQNGLALAKSNTLNIQTKKLVEIINSCSQ